MKLDPFYPIFENADWIERLVPHGIKLVQLRMKNCDKTTLKAHIQRAKVVCERYNCQLIINDFWQCAIEEGCNFVHIGQEDLLKTDIKLLKAKGIKFGVSTYNQEELEKALSTQPDYIALGPIYPTTTKVLAYESQGLSNVALWKKQIAPLPLVGIGGLTLERAIGMLEAGANSAAVISDITLNENPEQRVQQWIKATQPWR